MELKGPGRESVRQRGGRCVFAWVGGGRWRKKGEQVFSTEEIIVLNVKVLQGNVEE